MKKNIKVCRDLIVKGANFHVISGSIIQIWKDPWIPTLPFFKPDTSPLNPNLSWNLEVLNITFSPVVVKDIRKIQISPQIPISTLYWSPSKSRNFSSKSAYLVDQALRFNNPTIFPCL